MSACRRFPWNTLGSPVLPKSCTFCANTIVGTTYRQTALVLTFVPLPRREVWTCLLGLCSGTFFVFQSTQEKSSCLRTRSSERRFTRWSTSDRLTELWEEMPPRLPGCRDRRWPVSWDREKTIVSAADSLLPISSGSGSVWNGRLPGGHHQA